MPEPTILLAEDDSAIRMVVSRALSRRGIRVQATRAASTLWRWIEAGEGDAAIMDVMLPDENSLDILPQLRQRRPDLPVILMSANNTLLTAVRATERGAFEYLPKPFDLEELLRVVQRALVAGQSKASSPREEELEDERLPIIGRSPAMQEIYRIVARLVGTDLTVLISGESGTGKELVAKALHDYGKRSHGSFVAVNMAAIPRELIESELFGHEKGAFTGAAGRKSGRFEQAEGGTLFLDEIGDMPLDAQTRLLRVLQQGEYMPVGAHRAVKADVRIIAASHRDLGVLVSQGLFREDLFYRLNVVPIRLPPLRERPDDVAALVDHFLHQASCEGLPLKSFTPEALAVLRGHDWPGNVRELENLVRRLAVLVPEDVIGSDLIDRQLADARSRALVEADGEEGDGSIGGTVARHIDAFVTGSEDLQALAGIYRQIIREVERPLIERILRATRGNQLKAAAVLGLNRNTLRKKIRDLDIEVMRGAR